MTSTKSTSGPKIRLLAGFRKASSKPYPRNTPAEAVAHEAARGSSSLPLPSAAAPNRTRAQGTYRLHGSSGEIVSSTTDAFADSSAGTGIKYDSALPHHLRYLLLFPASSP